jgi:hypothetical protein
MTISSSSGSADSRYLPVWEESDYDEKIFVLTRDSLETDLDINPLGDEIVIEYECLDNYEEPFVLIFGNYPGSQIKAPYEWQSIASIGHYAYSPAKTNEPTIGYSNNTSKMYGTLTGKVYDKNKQLIVNDSISFSSGEYYLNYIKIDENGFYSRDILAIRYSKNYVYMRNKKIKITAFTKDIEPDSIHIQDIYLLEDITAIEEKTISADFPIRIYPNPLSGGQSLQYEIGTPVKSLDCRLELISMDGRMVYEGKIISNTGAINLPSALPKGMYVVNFKLNKKTHYSTKLIIE